MVSIISSFEDAIKEHTIANANNEEFRDCYHKCADKSRITRLHETRNHLVIFGRRGTGKTSLLKSFHYYINDIYKPKKDKDPFLRSLFIDMNDVVPNDEELQGNIRDALAIETYRAIMAQISGQLFDIFSILENTHQFWHFNYTSKQLSQLEELLIRFSDEIFFGTKRLVEKRGSDQTEAKESDEKKRGIEASVRSDKDSINFSSLVNLMKTRSFQKNKSTMITASYDYIVDVKKIRDLLYRIIDAMKIDCLYVCIDEFTLVDRGREFTVQPNIAQFIKDTLFRNSKIQVRISSLWNKSRMQTRQVAGARIGLEVGEDIQRGIDLDTMFFQREGDAVVFFKNMLANICSFGSKHKMRASQPVDLGDFIIDSLFKDKSVFVELICGSHGIPRVFGRLLLSCIENRRRRGEEHITTTNVFECIVQDYTQNGRKKSPNDLGIVKLFDAHVHEKKERIILISSEDYEKAKIYIEGMVDNNAIHQYPSEAVPRALRNQYKMYLVQLGSYLEVLKESGYALFRNDKLNIDSALFPQIPEGISGMLDKFLLKIPDSVITEVYCECCQKKYMRDKLIRSENTLICPDPECNTVLLHMH